MKTIKILRNKIGISQDKLAKAIGVSRSTVAMWEIGNSQPDNDMLIKLADYFGVSTDYLLENENTSDIPKSNGGVWIPVLGSVAAGIPITASENVIDYEEISLDTASKGEHFALSIKGNSMEPRIKEGDVVIVKQQTTVESGDVAIVLVNGDEATCKKVVIHENGISLVAFNQSYSPMFYTTEEIKKLPVSILGRVIELRGKF